MVDPRFFELLATLSLGEIAELTGAGLPGAASETKIKSIAAASQAQIGDLCYFEGTKIEFQKLNITATACFVKADLASALPEPTMALMTDTPRLAHIQATQALFRLRDWSDEGEDPAIHESATIAPTATICPGSAIGARSRIGPNAVIGPGVQIGSDTEIGANVSVRCALIGNHVSILSGARIGESGFGVAMTPDGALDVPQMARVIIQDHVLIGANACVDRGALTDTVIGERTKTDNMVQIAHGVVLGRNVLVASLTGISGSVKMGDNVVMGGQVGIAPGVVIGDNVQIAGSAGVLRDIPGGERWGGTPAKPLRQFLRETAWVQREAATKKKPKV